MIIKKKCFKKKEETIIYIAWIHSRCKQKAVEHNIYSIFMQENSTPVEAISFFNGCWFKFILSLLLTLITIEIWYVYNTFCVVQFCFFFVCDDFPAVFVPTQKLFLCG